MIDYYQPVPDESRFCSFDESNCSVVVKKNTEYGLMVFGSILMGLSIVIFIIYGLLHIAIECKSKLMIGTFISVVLSAGQRNDNQFNQLHVVYEPHH